MYAAGKLVMVLNVDTLFDEIAKRRNGVTAETLFDFMAPFLHNLDVFAQFCTIHYNKLVL